MENNNETKGNVPRRSAFGKKLIIGAAIVGVLGIVDYFNIPSKILNFYTNSKEAVYAPFKRDEQKVTQDLYTQVVDGFNQLSVEKRDRIFTDYLIVRDSVAVDCIMNNFSKRQMDYFMGSLSTTDRYPTEKKLEWIANMYSEFGFRDRLKTAGEFTLRSIGVK